MRTERILAIGLLVFCIGCKREPTSETDGPALDEGPDRPAEGQRLKQEQAPAKVAATDDGDILYVDGAVPWTSFDAYGELALTDKQVEELREKLKDIHFPALEGTTARTLGLPESKSSSSGHMWASIVPLGNEWECAHYGQRWWVLNPRFHLILAEGYYLNAHSDPMTLEMRALVTEDTSHESVWVKYCLPRSKLSDESVLRAKYGPYLRE